MDDVIIYKLKKVTRALLSPKGVDAFKYVAEHVSREALAELQKSSPSKKAPKTLLQTLRDAGLKISLDSGRVPSQISKATIPTLWRSGGRCTRRA